MPITCPACQAWSSADEWDIPTAVTSPTAEVLGLPPRACLVCLAQAFTVSVDPHAALSSALVTARAYRELVLVLWTRWMDDSARARLARDRLKQSEAQVAFLMGIRKTPEAKDPNELAPDETRWP